MRLTKRADKIRPSATIKIADKVRELEKGGIKIINLSAGEPHLSTPNTVKNAAIKAIQQDKTHYSQSRGILELRELICRQLNKEFGSNLEADKNVLITPGAKQAILYAILALVEEGDEVLISTPAWVSFFEMVNIAGGKIVQVGCDKNGGFEISLEKIKQATNKKTRLIILNSPNNPTGKIISKRILTEINKFCIDNNIILLCDEIYGKIIFSSHKFSSLMSVNPSLNSAVLINGFSKSYAMTGWRLGYVVSTPDLINAMLKFQQHSITCPTTFAQFGAIEALKREDGFIKKALSIYKENRNILTKEFKELKNFKLIEPEGGLYGFIDVSKINSNSSDFCLELIDKCKVAAVPGVEFGEGGEGYIRVCLATKKEDIIEFAKRLKEAYK
jgi:aspartate aminotransferase